MKSFSFAQGLVVALGLCFAIPILCAKETEPATALQASEVLDLSTLPLVDPVDPESQISASTASQSYSAQGDASSVAQKIREQLVAKGLKELEGATYSEAYSSANFEVNQFRFALNVFPSGQAGQVIVTLQNQSNLQLSDVPKPAELKPLYNLPSVAAYLSDKTVEVTRAECLESLRAQGWQPFGETTVSFYAKKNAVRLSVMVSEAPAQAGKTAVQYSAEQMSADLPVPPEIEWLQYTDSPVSMHFRSHSSKDMLLEFFQESLGDSGWKATTEKPIEVGFQEVWILRNPKEEMIEIEMDEVDGHWNCLLRFHNAAQVKAMDEKVESHMAQLKAERAAMEAKSKNPTKLKLPKLPSAQVAEQSDAQIEFRLKSGTAKGSVDAWVEQQRKAGWKVQKTIDTKELGSYSLSKDDAELKIDYVDPGFIPAEVTIDVKSGFVIEFEE